MAFNWLAYVIIPVIIVLLSVLLTYFISTRDIDSTVARITENKVENAIIIHERIEHKDDPWDIAKEKIEEHRINCGIELKEDIQKLDVKLDKLINKLINGI